MCEKKIKMEAYGDKKAITVEDIFLEFLRRFGFD